MQIDKTIKRPVLRYHGGKWKLAPWIVSHFPPHKIYVERFGGGGSVLMRKQRSYAEVYNDQWDTVVNVFQVLRDVEMAAELERVLRLTPFARTEFNLCGEEDVELITDKVEKARRTILRSFAGFGSASTNNRYVTGFRAKSNQSGTSPARDWVNYPDCISDFVQRLIGVCIENKHYAEVLDQQDSTATLVYDDPPYVHSTRNMKRGNAAYECEMSDVDHVALCQGYAGIKSMVVLSGYRNEIYSDLLRGWHSYDCKAHADGARDRIETLWLNQQAWEALMKSKNELFK